MTRTRVADGRTTCSSVACLLAAWSLALVPSTALAQGDQQTRAAADAPPSQVETGQSENDATPHDDGRRTLAKLPINFGRGVVGVFSLDNIVPFLGGAAATGVAFALDGGDKDPLVSGSAFGEIGHSFGNPVVVVAAATSLLAAGRIAEGPRFRSMSYDVFVATSVNFLYTEAIKLAIDRTRPDFSNNKSFPSGHTSNAFSWATVINHHYGGTAGAYAYAVATLIGGSRLDRGSHFFSDVVAGAALGFVVGRSITRQNGTPTDGSQISVVPMVGPSGQRGIGLTILY